MKFERPRPTFPKKAVITGGMPYGNKPLHFAHVGAVFIHADTFARFLRDRIGKENVRFVSGTDCYGSPALASYEAYVKNGGTGTIAEYVKEFHEFQAKVLKDYQIDLNLFGASAFGIGGTEHQEVSNWVFETLIKNGAIEKRESYQFYDTEKNVFLNGRQVIGKCPIDGCKSDKAYADECSVGHQYMQQDLIDPVSTLSGTRPELRLVENWYLDLPRYISHLEKMLETLKQHKSIRQNTYNTITEFLKKPVIYLTRYDHEVLISQGKTLYDSLEDDGKKPSVTYVFNTLEKREEVSKELAGLRLKFRTGKTLVPFRLSGNIEWGVKVPDEAGLSGLTFWVWPESLWAPISFVRASLKRDGILLSEFSDSKNVKVYQFIGEDNIYFYGIAQPALVMALKGISPESDEYQSVDEFTQLITNHHMLFLGTKAGSSSDVKPPLAHELLSHYTVDQLRMHFLGLGLSKKSVSFSPKVYDPSANEKDPDPVLKDGSVLTHVFNRVLRSLFYTSQTYFDRKVPSLEPTEEIKEIIQKAVLDYEHNMARHEFHLVIYTIDDVIRKVSKHWARYSKTGEYAQILADTFYASKVITTLLHPITPDSAENVRKQMNLNESLWDWEKIFDNVWVHFDESVENHLLNEIPPKYDFYARHESQLAVDEDEN